MRRTSKVLGGLLIAAITAAPAGAATLVPIGSATYDAPTNVTSPPGQPDRLIVTEQGGEIWQTTPSGTSLYLDLSDNTDASGEEGLWSVAFAPDFAQTGRFYAAYTAGDGAPQVVEFRERANAAQTEATARPVIAAEDNPGTSNHNGGQLQFGPDGYLYWSVGEDAAPANAQTTANLRGKILRIDPRGNGPGDYSVPNDNPFAGTPGARPEIWSLGLRNPWRFSFDRLNGALLIADVGDSQLEEVNRANQAAGGGRGVNFGWSICEGPCDPANAALTDPIYAYTNPPVGAAAIAGGYVVRDPDLGDLYGRYLFADTYADDLRSIDPTATTPTDTHRSEPLSAAGVTSFGEDSCGRLYVVSAGASQVYRLEGPSGGACPPPLPDTQPPQTTMKLKRKAGGRKYVARLTSSEADSTFECKLDGGKWKRCGEKHKLKRLDPGRHKLRARATDPAGNTDQTPAKKRFKVKRPR